MQEKRAHFAPSDIPPASSADDGVEALLRLQAEVLRADGKAEEAALLLGWAALYAARAR